MNMTGILQDISNKDSTLRYEVGANENNIYVHLKGYGCKGPVLRLCVEDGTPSLYVWSNVNQEGPAMRIDLSGAADCNCWE